MPTQSTQRADIVDRYGEMLGGLEPGPPDQPLAPGLPAGHVTDDTEQAAIVARRLIEDDGHIDPHHLAADLIDWQEQMRQRGSLDLLGPSTNAALEQLRAGVSADETGRAGTTNGAAMRIAPVGVAVPPEPLSGLVDAVHEASFVTHNTSIALSGAAAVAAAVSAGIETGDMGEATHAAIAAAQLGAGLGHWVAAADIATRIEFVARAAGADFGPTPQRAAGPFGTLAADDAVPRPMPLAAVFALAGNLIGTSVQTAESVPAAFVFTLAIRDPWVAVRAAASCGGDTDTVAAMAGAIIGAVHGPDVFPAEARAAIVQANPGLNVDGYVAPLLALRDRAAQDGGAR
jgi:ADP-ribosylglycohydrolase